MHRLGGLDLEADPVRELVDLAEDLFKLLAGEQVVKLAAAHRNQEEDIPHDNGELLKQVAQVVEVVGVVTADRGVDLDGNAGFVGPLDGLDGARPGAGKAAEGVVNLRGGAVERDAQPNQSRLFQLEDGFAGEQRRGAGGKRDLYTLASRIADQFEDVFPLQWIAASEDEDGDVHIGDLINKRLAFSVRQFVRMRDGLGGGAAVFAGQITGLRDFPDGKKGGFVKVEPAASGNIVHRLHKASYGTGRGNTSWFTGRGWNGSDFLGYPNCCPRVQVGLKGEIRCQVVHGATIPV